MIEGPIGDTKRWGKGESGRRGEVEKGCVDVDNLWGTQTWGLRHW